MTKPCLTYCKMCGWIKAGGWWRTMSLAVQHSLLHMRMRTVSMVRHRRADTGTFLALNADGVREALEEAGYL